MKNLLRDLSQSYPGGRMRFADVALQTFLVVLEKKGVPGVYRQVLVKATSDVDAKQKALADAGDEWKSIYSKVPDQNAVRGTSPLPEIGSVFSEKKEKVAAADFNFEKAEAAGLRFPLQSKDKYNADALKKGTGIEIEHTKDADIAEIIAAHHLDEDPKYYDKLEKVESKSSGGKAKFAEEFTWKVYSIRHNKPVTVTAPDRELAIGLGWKILMSKGWADSSAELVAEKMGK